MTKQFMTSLSVTDAFGFFKQVWGKSAASNLVPMNTNLEDLDQHLANLKAVEQWLTLNLNLLQATIQGVEIHRATIETFQSFGAELSKPEFKSNSQRQSSVPLLPIETASQASEAVQSTQAWGVLMSTHWSKLWADNTSAWVSLVSAQFNESASLAVNPTRFEKVVGASSMTESAGSTNRSNDHLIGHSPVHEANTSPVAVSKEWVETESTYSESK